MAEGKSVRDAISLIERPGARAELIKLDGSCNMATSVTANFSQTTKLKTKNVYRYPTQGKHKALTGKITVGPGLGCYFLC